jgi:DNA modification methylase
MAAQMAPPESDSVSPVVSPVDKAKFAVSRNRQRVRVPKVSTSNRPEPILNIDYWEIDRLQPADRVLRHHSKAQMAALTGSVVAFGISAPILVDRAGKVVDGHAILEAAKRVGCKTVPVIMLDHLTTEQARLYRIGVNKLSEQTRWNIPALREEIIEILPIAAFYDIPTEVIGLPTVEIDALLLPDIAPPDEEANDEGIAPEAVSRPGEMWELGEHRLICGDSTSPETFMTLMGTELARMVITDPPYNLRVDGMISGLGKVKHREFAMGSGEMTTDEFQNFLETYIEVISKFCVDGAIQYHAIDWRHVHQLILAVLAAGLDYKQLCVWNKSSGGMGTFYRSKHELFVVAKVGKAPHTNNFGLGDTGRYRTSVWDYPGANSFHKGRDEDLAAHPTVKPVALVADAIRDVSAPNEIVLDPFSGSGTTILAAELTNRRARASELDPLYVDLAVRRWQSRFGKVATLVGDGRSFDEIAAERLGQEVDQTNG